MFPSTLGFIVVALLIGLVTSKKQPGTCTKPCTGGKFDVCVQCPTPCPKTCEKPNGPDFCPTYCKKDGCECVKGYVRHNGKCILPNKCPSTEPQPVCNPPCSGGIHDKCTSCGSRCPLTCDNLNSDTVCTADCVVNVCQCEFGYARAFNKQCVLPKNCPARPDRCRADK